MSNTVVTTIVPKGKSPSAEFPIRQDGLSRIEEKAVNPITHFECKVKQRTWLR